ncbi:Putative DNA-binding domain-containing protein [Mucilaginibacter gossypiicola]|uniref:Putative DNA-binding domain-containing protein n=1 Tax=Mucilaginibacter gossypiicola TaxID=551995 RepID=A0A1H8M2F4_9SPHI|nr:ATP-binding protein [Mucilaginibacter gossypiicola]SEO11328.1 Putative DNA-binding domain-containing protein [Mucilaginibacter gossypiicola]
MIYNEEYLNNLIKDRTEENIHLDYKAADALERSDKKTQQISKDISAFANSDGGIIIYGLQEDEVNKHVAAKITPINRKEISKEWLEHVIQGSIQPRINDVKIYPIEVNGNIDDVVYVVDISKSDTAHQAIDRKYYKRFNFNSEPMYDYEIRDILNRAKHPKIELEFEISREPQDEYPKYYLNVYAKNVGVVLAKYIHCILNVPTDSLLDDDDLFRKTWKVSVENTFQDLTARTLTGMEYGPKRYQPLLPKMRLKLSHSEVVFNKHFKKYKIAWTVNADNAEPISGETRLKGLPVYDNI